MSNDVEPKEILVESLEDLRDRIIKLCRESNEIAANACGTHREYRMDITAGKDRGLSLSNDNPATMASFVKQLTELEFFITSDGRMYNLVPPNVIAYDNAKKEELRREEDKAKQQQKDKKEANSRQRTTFWIPPILSIVIPVGLALLTYYVPVSALETRIQQLEQANKKTTQPTTAPAKKAP